MKLLVSVALLVSSASLLVEGLSGGAPAPACDTLSPNPSQHGAQPQDTAVPYQVDLSAFGGNGTGEMQYTLGATYTLSVSGVSAVQFRGFFVQARQVSNDDNRVGTFAVMDAALSRLSSCPTTTDGITHTTNADKSTISFTWTAPMEETGAIRFGFAVVQVRTTYWANERTAAIQQVAAPTSNITTTMGATTPDMTTMGASSITSYGIWTLLGLAILVISKLF